MKSGRPRLFKTLRGHREWLVFGWVKESKRYTIVHRARKEEDVEKFVAHKYLCHELHTAINKLKRMGAL